MINAKFIFVAWPSRPCPG